MEKCLELIGPFEVFTPRGSEGNRLPYRRLVRSRGADGQYTLGYLTDFGTARERYANDDSWLDAQARAYIKVRREVAASCMPAPIAVGVIVPPNEGAPLPGGHYIPPGQLEALPRVFVVDKRSDGVPLPLILQGPPLLPSAARGLLMTLGTALQALRRSAMAVGLLPGHLDVEVSLLRDGSLEIRPSFHYPLSGDYQFSIKDLEAAQKPKSTLVGRFVSLLEILISWAKADGEALSWAALSLIGQNLDVGAEVWSLEETKLPTCTQAQQDALGRHVSRLFRNAGDLDHKLALAVLAAPPADSAAPRWPTRPLVEAIAELSAPAPPPDRWWQKIF